ncbi:uroporphyrinogen-III C-methyltransferase [Erythrobacter insulae]|uniref:uroporphyrinogen-III C-methyltransferase n=1 Tax=Erythrobacter insulae TaxID=2584124 RepID=A0A547PA75_9SPHN|nr:uroporphyrinogen-III C-methyltransferase [Erythrobacter insulae]TRD11036.1 uroporphyrinogen-III C-methyltransferase [Erythrobacter insulae]
MTDFPSGSVWLIGAGPGDPELLTRKAERLLYAADIVFYDALVSQQILDMLPGHIELQPVGKRAGRHSVPQPMICDLIVKAALNGKRVARLKGGDPTIFGRANEETDACRAAGVAVQICAGVTTASAAAASLTASLTTRGLARRLTFVTAHTRNGALPDLNWQSLADPEATIAVYMGKGAAPHIARGLITAGLGPDTPVVVVQDVSLSSELHFPTKLNMLPLVARTALGNGPAIILIGEAMRCSERREKAMENVKETLGSSAN